MNYLELNNYPLHWVFNRADMAISDADKAALLPLTAAFARQVWQRDVSTDAVDLERLEATDWLAQAQHWHGQHRWDLAFDSDEPALPAELAEYLHWDPNTVVYVCYDAEHIIETRYATFCRCWKALLFAAEQALVIGKRRKEVLWFVDEQHVKMGHR